MAGLTRIKGAGLSPDCEIGGLLKVKDSANMVGIGTMSPTALLHVQGPSGSGNANKARIVISEKFNDSATNFGIDFVRTYDTDGDNQDAGYIHVIRDGGASNAGMAFGIGNKTDTQREKMRINSDGSIKAVTTHSNGAIKDALRLTTNGTYSTSNSEESGPGITFGQFDSDYSTWKTAQIAGIRDGAGWHGALSLGTNTGSTATSVSEKVRILANGDVKINDGNLVIGTAGHGIDFGVTGGPSTMSSEVLDDYEEGLFTPQLNNNAWTGISFGVGPHGRYTKIGNVVHIVITIQFSSTGYTSNVRPKIENLPFTASNNQSGNFGGVLNFAFGTLELSKQTGITWYIPPNQTHATMYATDGSDYNSFPSANASNDWIQISGCYTAA